MNVLDLFSGACGGWSLGMHRAGLRTVACCEIDEWRRAQYAVNFPGVRQYDDIRTLSAERLRRDGIGPIDVVCGSPPCQDASTANTGGRGIDGERTGLYLEAVRLVGELRPRWAAFENVPGIRSRGIDRVLGKMEALDYACWPLVVGALDLGAPHIRKRSWVVCADAKTVQRLALPWDQPDGDNRGAAADADQAERRAKRGTRRDNRPHGDAPGQESPDRPQGGVAAPDAYARAVRQPVIPRRPVAQAAEPEELASADAAESGRAGLGRQGQERTAERGEGLERAIGERLGAIAENWNGGIAGRLGVDDGLPKGMAQPLLAAYGDTIIPDIAEIIGRAILEAERAKP